jgi:YgiT-type zinc finger domain-containing protein
MEPTEPHANPPAGRDPQSDAVLACRECGSETQADMVKAAFWTDRGLVVIEDIPARVCRRCAEQFYDDATAAQIERRLADPSFEPKRQILVPVVSLYG